MSRRSLSAWRSAGLLAIYLRSGKHVTIRGHAIPLFSFLLLVIGSLLLIAAAVFWLLPDGPVEPRLPLSIFGPLLLIAGWLSWKYYEPAEKRSVRLAVSIYLFFGMAITAGGLIQRFAPDPDAGVVMAAQPPTSRASRRRCGRRCGGRPLTRTRQPRRHPRARNKPGRSAPRNARLRGRSSSPKRKRKTRRSYASSPAAATGRR